MASTRRECKIILHDEVTCRIMGLAEEHIAYLYEKYGVFETNYIFTTQYKIGQWDGKRRFFNKDGTTYTYLLESVIPDLYAMKYKPVIDDRRVPAPAPPKPTDDMFNFVIHPETEEPLILRDYQINAISAVVDAGGYGIILASTSAGKTLICAALCATYQKLGYKTVTIVPNTDLLSQTRDDYVMCKLDVGEYSGDVKDIKHDHIISTWQALKNAPVMMSEFDVVIVDECHGAKGPELRKLLVDYGKHIPHRIGVTGTLPKEEVDSMLVHVGLGPVRYTITAAELIERGVLARPDITVYQLEENLTAQYDRYVSEIKIGKPVPYPQFKSEYFPDYPSEKDYLIKNIPRLEWIADFVISHSELTPTDNTLCLVSSIPVARKLAALIPNSIVVNGQDVKDPKKRKQIYQMFKNNDGLTVIATVHIAGTGINIPRIHHLVSIDIGKSFIRVIQSIGRGLRKAKGKDSVKITDICSDLNTSSEHLKLRKKYYKEAQYPFKLVKQPYTT